MSALGDAAIQNLSEFAPASLPTRSSDREMTVAYLDSKGQRRIKGGKRLKASQSYPIGFLDLSWNTRVCSCLLIGRGLGKRWQGYEAARKPL